MKKRARRRSDNEKVKIRTKKMIKQWCYDLFQPNLSPRNVGRMANSHGALCSCAACGNPRKHFKEKTLQEKRNELNYKEED